MLISLFSLLRKDTEMWHFRITEMSENPQKYHLFVYFCVFSPCEKMWFCAVNHSNLSYYLVQFIRLLKRFKIIENKPFKNNEQSVSDLKNMFND